jgi:hypothetical protein
LGIICKHNNSIHQLNYNQIQEHLLNYVIIKDNHVRKVGVRNNPFWIDGCSKVLTFEGNEFVEYSFRNINNKDVKMIAKMREKYSIITPKEFIEEALHFDEDIF